MYGPNRSLASSKCHGEDTVHSAHALIFTEYGSDCGIEYCKRSHGKINSVPKKSLNCLQEIKPHSGTYFILIH